MKCVPVHHGIPAVLHRDVPWLHRNSENGALSPNHKFFLFDLAFVCTKTIKKDYGKQ